ncbi:MAG: transcription-repair coupling factor, partial [Candidatus Brocadiia bacterium]
EDLIFFARYEPSHFQAYDAPPSPNEAASLDTLAARVECLDKLQSGAGGLFVSSVPAAAQPVPDRNTLTTSFLKLRKGDYQPQEDLIAWLVRAGFTRERMVERIGEFAVRGGILDVWPLLSDEAFRLEFFGDDIESIRTFDPITQRSQAEISEGVVRGLEMRKVRKDWDDRDAEHLFDELPPNTLLVVVEPESVSESAAAYSAHHSTESPGVLSGEAFDKAISRFQRVEITKMTTYESPLLCVDNSIRSLMRFEGGVEAALEALRHVASERKRVVVVCHNEAERDRLGQLLADGGTPPNVETTIGRITGGFDSPLSGLTVISDAEIFNRYGVRRRKPRKYSGTPLTDLLAITSGDYVVHVAHGIAQYEGIEGLAKDGRKSEYMKLRFASDVVIYVPLYNIDLVQKYIGAKGEAPTLSTIGGVAWENRKRAVEESVKDLAQELIRNAALRQTQNGIAHPRDTDWQRRFEAAFIYEETEDQIRCAEEIKRDLEKPSPMDRLLCGDVGFGKTEIAIRAIFKCVMGGRQIAVLVPTTLLAEQHFRTFKERMADYPVTVEVLSRFRTRTQQAAIVTGLKDGSVDVVIGTHRLLSEDISFKDLGLLIIDEEHKFGVEHKEALKRLKANVDVLVLSATPIPRTLHMSLVGLRDVSNLFTPPADRLAIITRVARFSKELIRRAIIRELDRSGQVYFLHNRVDSIERFASFVRDIVPEASVGVGHGQMNEEELENVMLGFLDGSINVLVCTTIVESGIDIPNANTMLINEADHFGLATLHQLRGRIGRYKHQGYCYLLVPSGRTISDIGKERLKAIEEFSDLGAGFQVAMRDMEIRGAGNMLGREQHGHIDAIGYELYCTLLEKTVRALKGEPPEEEPPEVALDLDVDTLFPADFPLDDNGKIRLYRRLIRMRMPDELDDLKTELEDIYGPLPRGVLNILEVHRLKLIAGALGIYRISIEDNGIGLRYRKFALKDVERMLGTNSHLVAGMLDDGVILRYPKTPAAPEKRLELLKKLLNAPEIPVKMGASL